MMNEAQFNLHAFFVLGTMALYSLWMWFARTYLLPCPKCGGSGRENSFMRVCSRCKGTGKP